MPMKDEWKGPQEEEYSFLQEVIKDEAGSRKTIKKKVLRRIGFGFVFGIVACFTFFASKSWIEEQFPEDPRTVTIPKDEEEEEAEAPDETDAQESQEVTARQTLQQLRNVAAEVEKSLVELSGYSEQESWEGEAAEVENTLAGVIIADNGKELLILSNDLLVKEADVITASFCDGSEYPVQIKKRDKNLGLCVYAVKREDIADDTWAVIQTAELGSSNAMATGDIVLALGKPFGYDNGVAYGVMNSGKSLVEAADGDYRLINTDISSYRDGSGVLTNEAGEVIGILCQISKKDGTKRGITAYAVSDIKRVIELLSNGENVPYVGLYAVDVTDEMQANGLPAGIYVKEVEADSPAMAAGIQSGDIITSIAGSDITTYKGYHNTLMTHASGEKIVLQGLRSGADKEYVEIEFNVKIGSKE